MGVAVAGEKGDLFTEKNSVGHRTGWLAPGRMHHLPANDLEVLDGGETGSADDGEL